MLRGKSEYGLAPVLLVALAVGLAFQGSRGLYETTEGRYALCAREMIDSGDWLEPTLLGQPHWTKPPVGYWGIAAGVEILGRNDWGARFFIAIAFAATCLVVAALGSTVWDRKTGFLAGLVYATSPFPALVAFTVNTDTFLALWEALAVLCFWRSERARDDARASRRWLVAMWAVFGIAFLTKGPPSLLPLIPVIVYRRIDSRRRLDSTRAEAAGPSLEPAARERGGIQRLFPLGGLVLFAAVGLSWYLYECWKHEGLLSFFLGKEVIQRVTTDVHGRNPEWYQPLRLYVPLLLLGGGLWTYDLARVASALRLHRGESWRDLFTRRGPALFLLLWVLLPFLIFSLSRSRMATYVVPLFPAVALAIARTIRRTWVDGPIPRRIVGFTLVSLVAIVAAKGLASYAVESGKDMGALYRLCARYDAMPGTRFAWFENRRGHGLDFYVSSPISRTLSAPVATSQHEKEGEEDPEESRDLPAIGEFLANLKVSDGWRRCVFISTVEHRAALGEAFAKAGIATAEVWGNERWSLARIDR